MEQGCFTAVSRRVQSMLAGVFTLLVFTGTAHAQGTPFVEKVPKPEVYGQWAGPWDLRDSMMIDPPSGSEYIPSVKEIGHSIVLPPNLENPQTSLYGGWVVFMNFRSQAPSPFDQTQPTFLWNPATPELLPDEGHLVIPNTPYDDVFCSGHTYLGDGRPMTAGGRTIPLDLLSKMEQVRASC